MLDFKDFAACLCRVEDAHVELPYRELEDENLFLGIRQLCFQQHDILHHSPLYLIRYPFEHEIALVQREVAEVFVEQQTLHERACLRVAQAGLRDDRARRLCIYIRQAHDVYILSKVEQFEVLFDFGAVSFVERDRAFSVVADFKQAAQPLRNGGDVYAV